MDHLKTNQERKDRWLARNVSPRFVPTRPAETWEELWDETATYELVRTLPHGWLRPFSKTDKGIGNVPLSQQLREILDCHGFLVVSNVLDRSDCNQSMEEAWDWIEAASAAELQLQSSDSSKSRVGCYRQDPSTLESKYFPRSVEGGMMPFYGSGHSKLAWGIRSNPNVKRVFEAIHDEETDLLSSLDGIVLWRGGSEFRTDPGWFHLDQNARHKPGPCAIQGLVNLLPTNASTGGNVLVAQSHKLFPDHYENNHGPCSEFYRQRLDELGTEDWMECDPNDNILLGNRSKVISCMLEPGDMLLWDSRTAHCSFPAAEEATVTGTYSSNLGRIIRAAAVVSMIPSKGVPKLILDARKLAVEQSRTLTHWVDKASPLGEEHMEHVQREEACVREMKLQAKEKCLPCTLLSFEELTLEQRNLVVGKEYCL